MSDLEARLRTALADRYRVEGLVGEGGMALVFGAEDTRHHRRVAVKVLRPEVARGIGAERFRREIELAARLHHPNIVPVYDSDQHDDILYYVMPFIEGESLSGRIAREGPLPVAEVAGLGAEIADALAYAHRQGVIHRDITPRNIMVHEGHALVADFGIATALHRAGSTSRPAETLTRAHEVLGTAEYMSPEQVSGERDLDGRSDLYSLGCVLYEMLTGRPPFTGRDARAVMARRFRDAPPDPREARPDTPAALAAVVGRCLALEPDARYADAAALREALRALPAGERLPPRGRRLAVRSLLVFAGVLGLAGAIAVWGPLTHDTDRRVVVMPFTNESEDSTLDELGDRIADLLVDTLTDNPQIEIAAAPAPLPHRRALTSAGSTRLQSALVQARESDARRVVHGSIYLLGDSLEIHLEITDARREAIVYASPPLRPPRADPARALRALQAETWNAIDSLVRGDRAGPAF